MELYHIDVFMPKEVLVAVRNMMPRASHAKLSHHTVNWLKQIGSDDEKWLYKHRYSRVDLRNALLHITRTLPTPFEVGVVDGRVVKYAVRQPLDEDNDITIVLGANNVVRTAWINSKYDIHRTLDRSKYVQKPNL